MMTPLAGGIAQSTGEGWAQIGDFLLALLMSGLIGLEREWRQKDAGLKTYTVVGIGSALFVLVSKYGFGDVVSRGTVQLDPSRVAAQIVSGLGFIGAGVIFTQRGSVKGLTSAAGIWMTAAVGAACAAGLPILAALCTATYLALTFTKPFTRKIADHADESGNENGNGDGSGGGPDEEDRIEDE